MAEEMSERDEPGQKEAAAAALAVARRSTQRLLNLIEILLEIARLQSGKVEIQRDAVDLCWLAKRIFTEFTPQCREYGVTLINDIPIRA
jgi:signal transduction histidine kinase